MRAEPTSSPPPAPVRGARAATVLGLLAAGIVLLVLFSALIGAVWYPPVVVFAIVLHQFSSGLFGAACGPNPPNWVNCTVATEIVWDARMPAIIVALFAGAALALTGGTLQGLFRNPLSDPFLLGLSSGAATGAAILFAFQIDLSQQATLLPLFAFAGGLVPGVVVYTASRGGWRSSETLILTGVALSSLFSAVLATLLFYNPQGGLQVSFWLLGGLEAETWTRAGILAGTMLAIGAIVALYGRELNVLQLGPEVATSVGVEAGRTARLLILLTTLLTAAAVAFTGVIGFVGLVSPHVVRRLIGPDYRRVLPAAALFGAIFLLGAWDLSEEALPLLFHAPVTLPVGIPTAFVGGPFFLYLLYRRRSAYR
jgi:ABC-type Fe3+-siderophore transport system permease subunit